MPSQVRMSFSYNYMYTNIFIDLSCTLEELKQGWLHPLLWELLRGDLGLYSKIRFFLKRRGGPVVFDKMFLLAPDSRRL